MIRLTGTQNYAKLFSEWVTVASLPLRLVLCVWWEVALEEIDEFRELFFELCLLGFWLMHSRYDINIKMYRMAQKM